MKAGLYKTSNCSTLCTMWKIKNFTATHILREIVLCIFRITFKFSYTLKLILCKISDQSIRKLLTFSQCGVLSPHIMLEKHACKLRR